MNFMRLSSLKAAHVAVAWRRVQEIRVSRSFFARCGIPLLFPSDSFIHSPLPHGSTTLPFVIPSEPGFPATLRWTQPRVRFSVGENRMKSVNANKINRKSGEAEGPAVLPISIQSPRKRPYSSSSCRRNRFLDHRRLLAPGLALNRSLLRWSFLARNV